MYSVIEDWKASDQTKKEFCELHGIAIATFQYWWKKYQQDNIFSEEESGFVSVSVSDQISESPVMELILTDGKRLNFYQPVDLSFLRALLAK